MKVLVVAHPDDEVLWFVPNIFDKIIITFCDRHDKAFFGKARRQALLEHPLRDIIINLNLFEPGYWKDKSRKLEFEIAKQQLYDELIKLQSNLSIQTIFTHNCHGEYGHDDHILVHNVCNAVFKQQIFCPTHSSSDHEDLRYQVDHELYIQVKAVYSKYNVWTWRDNHALPSFLSFKKAKK